jgi:hypothetical protein
MSQNQFSAVSPNLLLRLESLALLAGAIAVYSRVAPDWLLFALLLFVPDVAMIGYLRGAKLGSLVYNLGHTLAFSLALIALGAALQSTLLVQIGLIWTAHIALDRVLGYGLKYPTTFKDTHMQHV